MTKIKSLNGTNEIKLKVWVEHKDGSRDIYFAQFITFMPKYNSAIIHHYNSNKITEVVFNNIDDITVDYFIEEV